MPLGGLDAGHKGHGLAMLVDILCGVLAGARASPAIWPTYERGEPADVGHMVAAIDLAAFGSVDEFKRSMDAYIDMLHNAPRAPGIVRHCVAGHAPASASVEQAWTAARAALCPDGCRLSQFRPSRRY